MNKLFLIFILSFCSIISFSQQHPTNLIAYNITDNSVELGWTDNGCSNGFHLKYRELGVSSWIQLNSGITNPYILSGLNPATTYEWKVKCDGITGWSDVDIFLTTLCNKSIIQYVSDFTPDPLYGYMQFAYDTLSITSTANCDINIRPEFIISHQDSAIELGDFTIEWYNPIFSFWANLPYTIDSNGYAVGFWNVDPADITGYSLATGSPAQQMMIRVRFMNPNNNPNPTPTPYGTYTADWTTYEVDTLGNKIQALAPADNVSLSLVDCGVFTVNNSSFSDISCYGFNDGTATISTINNGSGSYTYSWNNGDSLQNVLNLQAGNYNCTITDNNWSLCTTTVSFTINEPNPITSNFTTTNVSCYGGNDGGAIVNFFGGTSGSAIGDTNYILGWAGTPLPLYLPFPNTVFNTALLPAPYNAVPAGVYPYTVTDLNGCTIYDTITISQPDSLYTAYTLTDYNGYNIACNGGNSATVDVQINGGTSPFIHYFNGSIINSNPIQNLGSGIFIDSIIDANGCIYNNNVTVTEPPALSGTVLVSQAVSCFGVCDGELAFSVDSAQIGTPSYQYSIDNGLTFHMNSIFSGLCGNIAHDVIVEDANDCQYSASVFLPEPSDISYAIDSIIDISTYGGNNGLINISAFGGSGNLNVSWSGPNGFSSTTEDISNLIAGTYYFTITDGNSCLITDSIVLSQPSSLSVDLSADSDVSCNGLCDGSIDITANGGDSLYSYLWTGPNGYTSTSEDINGLCSGTYNLALSDSTNTINYSFNINEPLSLFSFLSADSIICYNDFAYAEILVYGGTSPFGYNWSNGATNYFTDLDAGVNTIEVIDANGCILLDTILLSNPDSISLQTSNSDVSCFGMQDAVVGINVTNGGTAPYLYSANNGINNQPSSFFYNIGAGSYTYLVSDANGCSNEIHLNVNQPDSFYSSFSLTNTSCYGECDGIAITSITGGTPPYLQDWGGAISSALCAGYYNVIITDSNGCIITDGVTITEPNPIIVNIWQNGIDIEATSGFNTYQWYDDAGDTIAGATTNIFIPTIQGEYYVQVTDSNGCSINSYNILFLIDIIGENNLSVNIYPNPTNGKLIIECSEDYNTILIFNILGNTVCQIDNKFENQTIKTIDLSSFEKGIYFIQIEINNQLINQRIILQ